MLNHPFEIGASISSRTDASDEIDSVFSELGFPMTLHMNSNTNTDIVLPEILTRIPAMSGVEFEFKDIGVLKRVVSSIAQFARLQQKELLVTLYPYTAPSTEEVTTSIPEDEQTDPADTETGLENTDPENTETGLENFDPEATEQMSLKASEEVQSEGESTQQTTTIESQIIAEIVSDEGTALTVKVGDVTFSVKRNQVREDGSLTAGGLTAYEAAKAAQTE